MHYYSFFLNFRLCSKYGIEDYLFLQNPLNHQHIQILGTRATKIQKGELDEIRRQNSEWSSYTLTTKDKSATDDEVYTDQYTEEAVIQRFSATPAGICQLLVEAEEASNHSEVL